MRQTTEKPCQKMLWDHAQIMLLHWSFPKRRPCPFAPNRSRNRLCRTSGWAVGVAVPTNDDRSARPLGPVCCCWVDLNSSCWSLRDIPNESSMAFYYSEVGQSPLQNLILTSTFLQYYLLQNTQFEIIYKDHYCESLSCWVHFQQIFGPHKSVARVPKNVSPQKVNKT